MTAPSGNIFFVPDNLDVHRDLRETKQIFLGGAVIKSFVI